MYTRLFVFNVHKERQKTTTYNRCRSLYISQETRSGHGWFSIYMDYMIHNGERPSLYVNFFNEYSERQYTQIKEEHGIVPWDIYSKYSNNFFNYHDGDVLN